MLKYSPIVSNLLSTSDTILCKLGAAALKDLNCLRFRKSFDDPRSEVVAEIGKIPKFSTFTGCKVV
jgi:hypothetical protein